VKLTPGEIAHCIASTKMPPTEWTTAIAVALAESGGDTDALGVNDKGTAPTLPPVTWGSYDCGPWSTFNSGAHARFLPHAAIGLAHPFPVRPFPAVAVSVPAPVVNVTTQQVDLSGLEAQVAEVRSKFA
jgi:hypothetical protein